MLKTKILFLSLCMAITGMLFTSSMASAAMRFELDFRQDGTIESMVYIPMGEVVIADLYVSDVPDPGLISMGFTLTYDNLILQIVPANTAVDPVNWLMRTTNCTVSGEVTMTGGRLHPGLYGNSIKLGTIAFSRIKEEGNIDLTISAREDPDGTVDDFVLADGTVLDDELNGGIVVAGITDTPPLYDFDEDGDVDGIDLQLMSVCTDNCPSLADFASFFGTVQELQ